MHALPINTRLQDGKLAVSKPLGQGGFGITYYGGDVQLRRYVAIKEFFPQGCTRQANLVQANGVLSENDFSLAKRKFLEEARVLAQFRHQGIVQVYGFFEENNTAYIVMEYLKGKTLAQLVEERGALPEKEAVGYIEKAAEALGEVHRTNHLHRDIKPENIMVCEDGRVVLIDFGLTKKVEESVGLGTRQFTNTTRFGSDGYAPPEQYLKSGVLGTYTDVYALGATLYFLLMGKAPISAMERGMGEVLLPPKDLLPTISENVNGAIMQAMEMKPDARLQTMMDFAGAMTQQVKAQLSNRLSLVSSPASAPPLVFPPIPSPLVSSPYIHELGTAVFGADQIDAGLFINNDGTAYVFIDVITADDGISSGETLTLIVSQERLAGLKALIDRTEQAVEEIIYSGQIEKIKFWRP